MKFKKYLSDAKRPGPQKMEPAAKECINNFIHGRGSGDIQSAAEDTAAAYGWDAEDFYEVVMKVAKKMGVANKI